MYANQMIISLPTWPITDLIRTKLVTREGNYIGPWLLQCGLRVTDYRQIHISNMNTLNHL